ncbi:MAG: ComF family protein [Pseudomonadota bacterium]
MDFGRVLRVVYPDQCASCDALTDAPHGLCGSCWSDTSFLFGKACHLCGAPLPGVDDDDDVPCDDCLATPRPWQRGWAALEYQGRARSLILRLKHSDRTDLARPLANWMADRLRGRLSPDTIVVPVPSHAIRLIQRRYNQSALLARGIAHHLSLQLEVDALLRVRATPKLDGLTAAERFARLDRAIKPHPRRVERIANRPVLVVDDVMTSGATLHAATEALTAAGAGGVSIAVLARVLKAP